MHPDVYSPSSFVVKVLTGILASASGVSRGLSLASCVSFRETRDQAALAARPSLIVMT